MPEVAPSSVEELAETLRVAASASQTIAVTGNDSKRLMGGPNLPAQTVISMTRLGRVLQYEPNDLTISVEAGMKFEELQSLLARRGQMIALDPPFWEEATVGGVVASNSSGPMRRAFGTMRDLVIGMSFVTLEGKVVKSGGMVVKNVAGIDMAKLMIGSFGTLGVIATVNMRIHLLPEQTRTFLFTSSKLEETIERRNQILGSVLQPTALDLLSPAAAEQVGQRGFALAIRASGSQRVLKRYASYLAGSEEIYDEQEGRFWQQIREFSPEFLRQNTEGVIVRISTTLSEVGRVFELDSDAAICRAGSGVSYVYLRNWERASSVWRSAGERHWKAVVEFAPGNVRSSKELWLSPATSHDSGTFEMMRRIKQMFDPDNLLNRSRLYGRI